MNILLRIFYKLGVEILQRLEMKNFGPIKECCIDIDKITIFTGPQAAGKSTVAKMIYFFSTVGDDVANWNLRYKNNLKEKNNFFDYVYFELIEKFFQIFGEVPLKEGACINYYYGIDTYIKIFYVDIGVIKIFFSDNITSYLLSVDNNKLAEMNLAEMLSTTYKVVYIPSGRNLTTIFGEQLSYIYASMDDNQKRLIDLCTRRYIEMVLKLKPFFSDGVERMVSKLINRVSNNRVDVLYRAYLLSKKILGGEYKYRYGHEQIILDENADIIDVNYASSGQQEALWIINLLVYYMLDNKPTFFIIEEPESHLYPNAQKLITEMIALATGESNSCIITTHSPYVLGALNNLIYAAEVYRKKADSMENILKENNLLQEQLISVDTLAAYHVESGCLRSAIDKEEWLIDNSVIDGASSDINQLFDAIANVDYEYVGK